MPSRFVLDPGNRGSCVFLFNTFPFQVAPMTQWIDFWCLLARSWWKGGHLRIHYTWWVRCTGKISLWARNHFTRRCQGIQVDRAALHVPESTGNWYFSGSFFFRRVVLRSFLVTDSPQRAAAKEAGMITLKIKRITRVFNRPPNAIQSIPGLAVLGKRQVGDLCIGSESSTLIGGIDWHVFRFGEEVQAFEQYSSTWSVLPYDQEVPGATKPSTYVSFVFRYRSPGISSRNLSWFRE